ncbi:serine/threonine-protein phosphatase [Actinomadura graeca]|uniref:Serine/threonine-protein phosphatase n=1 Tax=Actinomadura graeca TaxID=2750812 RepID=A0ABX8QN92_9ACTN|nr:PP2C family protein-serine/threonine phosphatase [Actinomadura graeca]QXJ20240.1 serine/threonine-protein phosphatase [Actinomadura graeca]
MNADVEAGGPPRDPAPADAAIARLSLLTMAGARMAGTLDMERVARQLVEVALGGFADTAGVYVAEHLIVGDEVPRPSGSRSVEVRRIALGAAHADLEDCFPPGEVLVFAPDTAVAACVREGTLQRFAELPADIGTAHPGARDRLGDLVDFVLVPLRTDTAVLGFAAFARDADAGPFTAEHTAVAAELAALAAGCLDNARRYQREHAAARALQAGLLPRTPGTVPGVQVAHRSVPAGHANLVGGDWCDIVPLPAGRVALVIGDAMGHGSAAAAAMVQLRAAARTLAMLDLGPARILTWLDRIAPSLGPVQFATCACAVLDTATRTGVLGRAGHPPPIMLRPDGGCDIVDMPPGLPLGLGNTVYEDVSVPFPDGTTLVLYTDGLIESRERDLEAGLAALRSALADATASLDEACGAVVAKLVSTPSQDDVTVMLVRAHDQDEIPGPEER